MLFPEEFSKLWDFQMNFQNYFKNSDIFKRIFRKFSKFSRICKKVSFLLDFFLLSFIL